MVERARAADDARLDSLFVGDHHATGPGAYYQNTPMLGRLLAEWGDRPAGALFLLPLFLRPFRRLLKAIGLRRLVGPLDFSPALAMTVLQWLHGLARWALTGA